MCPVLSDQLPRARYPLMDENGFKVYVAKTMIQSLMRDFPEETREVIRELSLRPRDSR